MPSLISGVSIGEVDDRGYDVPSNRCVLRSDASGLLSYQGGCLDQHIKVGWSRQCSRPRGSQTIGTIAYVNFEPSCDRIADLTQERSAPPTCKRTPHCKDNKHDERVRWPGKP
ncbi:hypothetical protein BHE74_00042695 [Ensete ventricosum]|nr:hypothetical protein BHE74_00042695 [Ensete ventricosum]